MLLLGATAGLAAPTDFLLGINFSEWGPYYGVGNNLQIAADGTGALYILSPCTATYAGNGPSCLTKYGADGKTVVWQNRLGVFARSMAVDPGGEVYLSLPTSVEKLAADGTTIRWTFPITAVTGLTVDTAGRAFVLGGSSVIRLNVAGAIDSTFGIPQIPGIPEALAVDPTGSYILVAFREYPSDTFALLGPVNPGWVTFTPPLGSLSPGISVAAGGDAVIYGTDINGNRSLQRFDPNGTVVFSKTIPSQTEPASSKAEAPGNLLLDAAGNAYLTSYTAAFGTPVRNSLAPCGAAWLGVYAPDGSVLQITYLPGATNTQFAFGLLAIGGPSVFVLDVADTTFHPTQAGPFPQYPYGPQVSPASFALINLSPNASAQTVPLACVVNAASFITNMAVVPGELVTLYGNSLGPELGVAPAATLQSPFPTEAGGTRVTFDGKAAPLLWVQDSQVNVAVPSVSGPTTQICVTYNDVQTNCLAKPVAQSAPGVFTLDGVHAAVLNQDGTMNSASNPAPRNSTVAIWATGLGPIRPSQPDGSLVGEPLPVNAGAVSLGTLTCVDMGCPVTLLAPTQTTYAGPAPLLIAGTTQINFNLGESPPNSFVVSVASASSPYSNTFQIFVASQ